VRQDNLEELERTLAALEREYGDARARGDRVRAQRLRQAVQEALQHARWALRRAALPDAARDARREMIDWMTVWLENPGVFGQWLALRKRATGGECL